GNFLYLTLIFCLTPYQLIRRPRAEAKQWIRKIDLLYLCATERGHFCPRSIGMLALFVFDNAYAAFFLRFLDDLLRNNRRNFIIMIEFHSVGTARAGYRIQG